MTEFPIGSIWAPRFGNGSNRRVVQSNAETVWYTPDSGVLGRATQGHEVKSSDIRAFRRWAGKRLDDGGDGE